MLILFAAIPIAGCKEQPVELGMVTIEKDTTWEGRVLITGDVYVPPGVTLTVAPGTVIRFKRMDELSGRNMFGNDSPYYPQAELIIRGRIIAQGTKDRPIIFTSAEIDPKPADWGAINLLGSRGNVFEYCKVLCAYNGIHAHSSSAVISHSEFTRNGVAISVKKEYEFPDLPWFGEEADVAIAHNRVHKNKGGITFRASRVYMAYNDIRENKFFGIWPKEECSGIISYNDISGNKKNVLLYQVSGLLIRFNNIQDGGEYDVAVAEGQDVEIDLSENWWGTINEQKIRDSIFDDAGPEESKIIYLPILKDRVKGAGA